MPCQTILQQIHVRQALWDEMGHLATIECLSRQQKYGMRFSNAELVEKTRDFQEAFNGPDHLCVATVPAGHTNADTIYDGYGREIVGMMYFCGGTEAEILKLYTVKSEHLTGSALLKHAIQQARTDQSKLIEAWSMNQTSTDWYVGKGFRQDHSGAKRLRLYRSNFDDATLRINAIAASPRP